MMEQRRKCRKSRIALGQEGQTSEEVEMRRKGGKGRIKEMRGGDEVVPGLTGLRSGRV